MYIFMYDITIVLCFIYLLLFCCLHFYVIISNEKFPKYIALLPVGTALFYIIAFSLSIFCRFIFPICFTISAHNFFSDIFSNMTKLPASYVLCVISLVVVSCLLFLSPSSAIQLLFHCAAYVIYSEKCEFLQRKRFYFHT